MSILKARDVEQEIRRRWAEAHAGGAPYVDIRAGEVRHKLGGENRVPQVCQAMMRLRDPQDLVIDGPPSGQGTSLTIRYLLPRGSNKAQEPAILAERPLADDEPQGADEQRRASHDAYGKLIMKNAAGSAFSDTGPLARSASAMMPPGRPKRLDKRRPGRTRSAAETLLPNWTTMGRTVPIAIHVRTVVPARISP